MLGLGFLADDSAMWAGRIYGGAVLPLVVLILIAKAYTRRPDVNRRCVQGLLLVLVGWLLVMLTAWATAGGDVLKVVAALVYVVALGMFVAGTVLAIVGLVQCRRDPQHPKGRGRAIGALIGSGLFLAIMAVGVIAGGIYALSTMHSPTPRAAAEKTLTFEDLNLRYRAPGHPYESFDVKKLNAAATFGLLRTNPTVMLMVVAERGPELALDSAGLAELSKAALRSGADSVTISDDTPREFGGLGGVLFNSDAVMKGKKLTYVHWVTAHNGFLYQFIVFGEQARQADVRRDAEMLFGRFELIDPERTVDGEAAKKPDAFGTFTSPLGYTLDLAGTKWTKWADVRTNAPEADVGGKCGLVACMEVAAIDYGKEKPPCQEALNKVLLRTMDIKPNDANLGLAKPVREGDLEGQVFEFVRTGEDKSVFDFRIRVLSGSHVGLLAAVWTKRGGLPMEPLAAEVFKGLSVTAGGTSAGAAGAATAVSPEQIKTQAYLQNQVGLFYQNAKQYENSLGWFAMAGEKFPDNEDYLNNTVSSLYRLGRYEEALKVLDARPAAVTAIPNIRSWKAMQLTELGRQEEAAAILRTLFAEGHHDDDDFIRYVGVLTTMKRWDEGRAAFDAYLKTHDSPKLRLEQADFLHKEGKHADAVEVLKKVQQGRDFDPAIAYALIRNYESLEQPRDALAVCEEIIAKGFASADAWYLKGDAESELKWYRQAKESYTKALAFAPKAEWIQKALRDVSAVLGEGDNASIQSAIEPVPLPEEIGRELPPLTAKGRDGFGAFYLSRVTGYAFERKKDCRHTVRMRIKVLDAAGVSRFSTIQRDYDPVSEDIYVNELVVRDESGKVVSRGQVNDYYVVDDRQGDAATTGRVLHLPVPQLQPGHIIDLTVTTRSRGAPEEFYLWKPALESIRPILFSAAYYVGKTADIRYVGVRVPEPKAIPGGLAWVLKEVPAFESEPMQPDSDLLVPTLYVADSRNTWESVAAEYLKKIGEKLVLDDAVRAAARDVTRQADTRAAKIAALAGYVQKICTYKAIEFGRRAMVPNTAAETLAHKYGDCKDHAVLLHEMLAAVEIPSYLALVGGEVFRADLPTLDQFDHMIVCVPEDKALRFIDTTNKEQDLGVSPPNGLATRSALVLDPARPRVEQIPPYGPGARLMSVDRTVQIGADLAVRVRETVRMEGVMAAGMRGHLKDMEPARHLEWARSWTADFVKTAKVQSFNVSDIYDNTKPLILELVYEIPAGAQKVADGLAVRLPDTWEREYLGLRDMKRQEPVQVRCPLTVRSTVTITPPPGHAVIAPGPAPGKGGEPTGRWEGSIRSELPRCTLQMTCDWNVGTFPAAEYSPYHALMEQAIGWVSREIRCRKEPANKE